MSSATDHLPRLLALVPWLLAHPDTPIDDVAAEFGVPSDQIRADLNLIWMCGLPGQGPGDLIDVFITGDRVTLANADTIAAPLRLTASETVAVIAGLRVLSNLPGIADTGAVERALAKLEDSAGGSAAADRVTVAGGPDAAITGDPAVASTVREGLTSGLRLRIDYWVPARDEVTHRDVDPIRIRTSDAATYLIGWCRSVGDVRTFRVDRILAAEILDIAADIPPDATIAEPDARLFTPSPEDQIVRFALRPAGRWVIDYYPVEAVDEAADGSAVVTLRGRDEDWVIRLALALGSVGTLLEPAHLKARAADRASRALAHYDSDVPNNAPNEHSDSPVR